MKWRGSLLIGAVLVAAVGGASGCKKKVPPPTVAPVSSVAAPSALTANAAHGKELVEQYQCNRCHSGLGVDPAPQSKNCVQCHADIVTGIFKAPITSLTKWRPRVEDLTTAPSLEAMGARFSADWVASFLLEPRDLRPGLKNGMPRLDLTAEQARDIAAYLTRNAEEPPSVISADEADMGKGRQLLDSKGCGGCHKFTGVAPVQLSPLPVSLPSGDFSVGTRLAPDLRVTRERFSFNRLVNWLLDPRAVKPDTTMPKIFFSNEEARDLAQYILKTELSPLPDPIVPKRLPILERPVTYKEVDAKIFHRTCWHCHSEPDYAIGDGGPGNSGGFGFKPRGLNLSDYNGISAGVFEKGSASKRISIFAPMSDGTPRIIKVLMQRHAEAAGAPPGEVRGMPLAYPPIPLEDIQLLETWIAQGRPR